MNNDYMVILSSGEIYVLAGLMGYSSVFAIEDETLKRWYSSLKQHVHETIKRLEKRMLILFEPGGTIFWEESVAKIIRCMCEPEAVFLISGSIRSGKRSELHVLRYGDYSSEVSRCGADVYKIQLTAVPDGKKWLTPIFDGSSVTELHESMLIEDVQNIRDAIEAFEMDKAEEYVRGSACSESSVQGIINVLSGTNRFLSLQCKHRGKGFYYNIWNCLLIRSGEQVIRLKLDEFGRLHFDGAALKVILGEINKAVFSG